MTVAADQQSPNADDEAAASALRRWSSRLPSIDTEGPDQTGASSAAGVWRAPSGRTRSREFPLLSLWLLAAAVIGGVAASVWLGGAFGSLALAGGLVVTAVLALAGGRWLLHRWRGPRGRR